MLKVGITPRTREIHPNQTEFTLETGWFDVFAQLNCLPVIIPIGTRTQDYLELGLDAIVLSGGGNLSELSSDPWAERRDKLERQLIEFTLAHDMPLLGICRGAQLIASYYNNPITKIENHVANNHSLSVVEDTPLQPYLASISNVNSYHDFGLTSLKNELTAAAFSDDGSVECFYHPTKPILGMMWHPERTIPLETQQLQLIKDFLFGKLL